MTIYNICHMLYNMLYIPVYFFSQNPNFRFFLFQYTNVHFCAKFGGLNPTIDETQRPQIWTCFWARCRNNIQQGNCEFLSTKCFMNINRSLWSADYFVENWKPRVMLWDQRGDTLVLNSYTKYLQVACSTGGQMTLLQLYFCDPKDSDPSKHISKFNEMYVFREVEGWQSMCMMACDNVTAARIQRTTTTKFPAIAASMPHP